LPVIRIDREVWTELQKRAEPLVDTPNSVLRRILGIEKGESDGKPNMIEIELATLHTPRTFAAIPVPKSKRSFFPGYKVDFDLESDVGVIRTRVTSAPRGTPVGDPEGGAYIQGGLRNWYDEHPDLKLGDKLRFEAIDHGKRYKLSIVRNSDKRLGPALS